MAGVISFSETEADTFMIKGSLYRLLLQKAETYAVDPDDEHSLQQAIIFQSLPFEEMEPGQQHRLAVAVAAACREVRQMLHPDVHAIDRGFDSMLQEIQVRLRAWTGGAAAPPTGGSAAG
jgi:hypothetical protein